MAIQTITATIQMRYGMEADLQPDQLVTGEWAVATDTKKIWMCFRPGLVLRMATYEAFEQDMKEIQLILATCQDIQVAVERFKQLAEQHASQAEEWSVTSKSWAIGGTGTREGEDTDNSKYYSEQSKNEADRAKNEADRAAAIAGIDIDSELSETSANPVQNKVITKALDNKLSIDGNASNVTVEFDQEEEREDLLSGDKLSVFAGKVKKWLSDLSTVAFTGKYSDLTEKLPLINNFLTTEAGVGAADAKSMADLKNQMDAQNTDLANKIGEINKNLGIVVSGYVAQAITLPANMENYTELCRTPTVQPGTYIIYYRMSNFADNISYQIQRSDNGQYVSVFAGQNGMDVVGLSVSCALIIVARNRGSTAFTVSASGNNKISVMRIK